MCKRPGLSKPGNSELEERHRDSQIPVSVLSVLTVFTSECIVNVSNYYSTINSKSDVLSALMLFMVSKRLSKRFSSRQ